MVRCATINEAAVPIACPGGTPLLECPMRFTGSGRQYFSTEAKGGVSGRCFLALFFDVGYGTTPIAQIIDRSSLPRR